MFRLALFICMAVALARGFEHQAPSGPCTTPPSALPADANDANTYDYIFLGSGSVSTVVAAKLAEDQNCANKILIIEAGRSYTKEPECSGDVDCYIQGVENDYHQFPHAASSYQSLSSRSNWPFQSKVQDFAHPQAFSDGRPSDECIYDDTNVFWGGGFFPSGCACTSDAYSFFSALCPVSQDCLDNNGGSEAVCGKTACQSPPTCAINGTNYYPRASAKGGSNSHHALVTYKMTPIIADRWVENTGDPDYAWEEWERALFEATEDWFELSFTARALAPVTDRTNSTIKDLIWRATMAEIPTLNDLTGPNKIMNNGEFFDVNNRFQKKQQGYIEDLLAGRQVRLSDGKRSFPSYLLDRAMDTCGAQLQTLCDAFGTKIIFADQPGKLSRHAIGVEYITGGADFQLHMNHDPVATAAKLLNPSKAYARKGVIIGGGVFNSPSILMHSGIGDEEELGPFGIPVRKHLGAVGKNLQDDHENSVHFRMTSTADPLAANGIPGIQGFANKGNAIGDLFQGLVKWDSDSYDANGNIIDFSKFPTQSMCHADAPMYGGRACPTIPNSAFVIPEDIHYLAALKGDSPSHYIDGLFTRSQYIITYRNEQEKLEEKYPTCHFICGTEVLFNGWYDVKFHYNPIQGTQFICALVTARTLSKGRVKLQSDNPTVPLLVDQNTFSHPDDIEHASECINVIRRIIKRADDIAAADPMKHGGIRFSENEDPYGKSPSGNFPFAPGPDISRDTVTDELRNWVKISHWSHHPMGSNRMGNVTVKNSVVDNVGRVWGTQNLFVMDMSSVAELVDIFPSNNAVAFGHLLAEKLKKLDEAQGAAQCDVPWYCGAQRSEDEDAEEPLKGTVIGLGVATAVLAVVVVSLAITIGVMRRGKEYQILPDNAQVQQPYQQASYQQQQQQQQQTTATRRQPTGVRLVPRP